MQQTTRIQNLIFDLGGVVVHIKPIDFNRFDKQLGLLPGTIRGIIKTCSREVMVRKRFNERRFFEKQFAHLLSWEAYARILQGWFATERVNEWLIRWIERRKGQYRIYLLTNQTGTLPLRLKEKYRIAHHFDRVFNSAEIGIAKPDHRIFRYLLRSTKADAKTCLFIDNKRENILAARKLGFHAIYFKNNRQFAASAGKLDI